MNLVTLAEYKAHAGLSSPNEDARINGLIPAISEVIKQYCKTSFIEYYTTPKVDISSGGTKRIYLSEVPLVNLISVECSYDYGVTFTPLVHGVDYAGMRDSIISLKDRFPEVYNGYKITYNAGYPEVPVGLKLAVFDLITYYRKNDMAIHSNKAPGTNSVQIEYASSSALPSHIRRVLNLYSVHYA